MNFLLDDPLIPLAIHFLQETLGLSGTLVSDHLVEGQGHHWDIGGEVLGEVLLRGDLII